MKKVFLVSALCIAIFILSAPVVFAQDSIIESPDIKIIIDGQIGTYDDIPIIVNGKTLLPFRAVLMNLGIPNDDRHIIWNGEEQSVTVIKESEGDTKKIYLKLGDTAALVDDIAETLDVAPMLYNSTTYIPARFIAQSLGKKVIWDGSSNAVLIRDQQDFDNINALLDKMAAAMEPVKKFQYTGGVDMNMFIADIGSIKINATSDAKMDYDKKVVYVKADTGIDLGSIPDVPAGIQKITVEAYYANDAMYMSMNSPLMDEQQEPITGQWIKSDMSEELFNMIFEKNNSLNMFNGMNLNDTYSAALVMDESSEDTIVLKGNVYLGDIIDQMLQLYNIPELNQADLKIKDMYIEMYLDKDTYLIDKSNIKMQMLMNIEEQTFEYDLIGNYIYDYSTDFEIELPEEFDQAIDGNSLIQQ